MHSVFPLLLELRKRLLTVFFVFCCFFVLCFWGSDFIFHWVMLPLKKLLPSHSHLIATNITTPVIAPLSLAMTMAMFCTAPYCLWHIWHFAAPALYRLERRRWGGLLFLSVVLFGLGCGFCYFFILPCMFQCFIHSLPKEVVLVPDIQSTLPFVIKMLILFGCSFQIPLLCFLLLHLQILNKERCHAIRPYVIVAAFTIGMLLTPPDVLAQILLAMPLWGLFELGIFLTFVYQKTIR